MNEFGIDLAAPKYGDSHPPDLTSVWVKLDRLLVVKHCKWTQTLAECQFPRPRPDSPYFALIIF